MIPTIQPHAWFPYLKKNSITDTMGLIFNNLTFYFCGHNILSTSHVNTNIILIVWIFSQIFKIKYNQTNFKHLG